MYTQFKTYCLLTSLFWSLHLESKTWRRLSISSCTYYCIINQHYKWLINLSVKQTGIQIIFFCGFVSRKTFIVITVVNSAFEDLSYVIKRITGIVYQVHWQTSNVGIKLNCTISIEGLEFTHFVPGKAGSKAFFSSMTHFHLFSFNFF